MTQITLSIDDNLQSIEIVDLVIQITKSIQKPIILETSDYHDCGIQLSSQILFPNDESKFDIIVTVCYIRVN